MSEKKKRFLFVVEGAKREMDIFENFASVFFNDKSEIITISAPADMNIYMLYDVLKKDNFETDIVEVLKERVSKARSILKNYTRNSFAEIYLFFDFDAHANNLRKKSNVEVLKEMLEVFNNETELGKLYISYPMVEAIRDHEPNDCGVVSGSCFRNRTDFGTYKRDSANLVENNNIANYDFAKWMTAVCNYVYRSSCFFGKDKLDRYDFVDSISPLSIFNKQIAVYEKSDDVFILSCLPEFLIDYSTKYWDTSIGKRKKPVFRKGCDKK